MQRIISLIFKVFRKLYRTISVRIVKILCVIKFYVHNVQHKSFTTHGIPFISVAIGGTCFIDSRLTMNNNVHSNPIGRIFPCVFFVDKGASLHIGKNVGISSTALIAHQKITIGDNVMIGGGVCIYDTDFHSLDFNLRINSMLNRKSEKKLPVHIEDNVFIGAHSTILKGVTIGKNSIIGACSVVAKSVPPNEIWAGNPARFIKKIT